MSKLKFYKTAAIALLLLNLGIIAFFLVTKPKHPQRRNPRDFIIEKLDFDNTQKAALDKEISAHRHLIRQKEVALSETRSKLFQSCVNTDAPSKILLENLSNIQKEIDKIHFNHFKAIQSICYENQLGNFKELTKEIEHHFAPRPPKK